jgi:O-antigen/teichoic acid export membrane protein
MGAVVAVTVISDDAGDLRQIGGGSLLKILGGAGNAIFSLGLIMVVTRGYSQDRAGTFFAATTLFLLIGQASEIGADEAMLRYIPAFRASGRRRDVARLVRFVLLPVVIASIAAAVAALAFAPLLAHALSSHDTDPHAVSTLLRMLVPFIPMIAIGEVVLAATRGFQRMGPSMIIYDIGLSFVQAALPFVALLLVGQSIVWLVIAWVVPYALVLIAAAVTLRSMIRHDTTERASNEPLVTGYSGFVVPRALARLAQYGLRRIDVVFVAAFAGVRDAAIYTAITRLITVGNVAVQAVQQVAQPKLGELFHLDDRRRSLVVFQTSIIWLIVVSWPVFALFGVFAPILLRAFGHGYGRGATALTILCLSQLITVATGPVDIALVMKGRSLTSLVNQTVALALDIVLCVVLIPHIGIVGAAVARVVALQWNNLVPAVQVYLLTRLHPFSRASAAAGATAALCFGLLSVAARAVLGPRLVALGAVLVIGGVIYLIVLRSLRRTLRLDALIQRTSRAPQRDAWHVDTIVPHSRARVRAPAAARARAAP